MQRNNKTNFRSKLSWINTKKAISLPSNLKTIPNRPLSIQTTCTVVLRNTQTLHRNLENKQPKICNGILRAKLLTNGKQLFQLSCALNNLCKELFFNLIRSVIFEKRLSSVFIIFPCPKLHWIDSAKQIKRKITNNLLSQN